MEQMTVYGHAACPQVPPLKAALNASKVPYTYINIHEDADARQRVREINDGNESVPTLVFADGSTLTEPSTRALRQELAARGYQLSPIAWLLGNAIPIVTAVIVVFALLRAFSIL